MICEVCGKNATFFFKQIKNGYAIEKALCSECASKNGLTNPEILFDAIHDDFFGGLLGSFANKEPKLVTARSCEFCGMTIGELLNGGKVGCAHCYEIFERSLAPTIAKIHGNVAHCGKTPEKGGEAFTETGKTQEIFEAKKPETPLEKLEYLKNSLKDSVEKQEYELAAQLRDEIKALEADLSSDETNGGGEK